MPALLLRLDRGVAAFCKWGVVACLIALSVLLLLAVLVRFLPWNVLSGYDEAIEWLFAWMSFLGALALWREGTLYRVGFLDAMVSEGWKRALGVFNQALMLAVALVLTLKGGEFMAVAGETMPFLGLDKGWWYLAIPATGAVMTLYSIAGMWRAARGEETFVEIGASFS
ncbi:TRAP transporter small permease [uncultured Enterovirga sp.]|uniref:TRAP transporter small permease n=1 Tax=uncultured Enterovirga sp. TaxID=2026352 RepID=UPI0035C9AAFC